MAHTPVATPWPAMAPVTTPAGEFAAASAAHRNATPPPNQLKKLASPYFSGITGHIGTLEEIDSSSYERKINNSLFIGDVPECCTK